MPTPIELFFRALATARGRRRAVHPVGRTFHATVRAGGGGSYGVALLDEPGEYDAIVRLSRGAGLPVPLPDVLGAAVRVCDGGGPGVDLDLLMSTTVGRAAGWRQVPAPRRNLATVYTTMSGYGTRRGRRYLALLPDPTGAPLGARPDDLPTDGRARFLLVIASRSGRWRMVGRLVLGPPVPPTVDRGLAFDPVEPGVVGLRPDGLLWRARRAAYRGSRTSRGAGAFDPPRTRTRRGAGKRRSRATPPR